MPAFDWEATLSIPFQHLWYDVTGLGFEPWLPGLVGKRRDQLSYQSQLAHAKSASGTHIGGFGILFQQYAVVHVCEIKMYYTTEES